MSVVDLRSVEASASRDLTDEDLALADGLRRQVTEQIANERRRREQTPGERLMSEDDERAFAAAQTSRLLSAARSQQLRDGVGQSDQSVDQAIKQQVAALIFGHGALEPLLADPNITDIELNGSEDVWVLDRQGRRHRRSRVFGSDAELVDWVRHRATYSADRSWDPSHPSVEIELDGGHRLTGIMGATPMPCVTIRLLRMHEVSLEELMGYGTFGPDALPFFQALVRSKQNVIIAGETGAGKTVFLRALASCFGRTERILTVEHFRELGLHRLERHPSVIPLAEIAPNAAGLGGFTVADCVRASRRHKPDRLIVGECVGEEVYALLDAMTQGNKGCMTTMHTKSASATAERVALYARNAGIDRDEAMANFAQGVDFVVHVEAVPSEDGSVQRRVSSVTEVVGYHDGAVVQNRVWEVPPGGTVIQSAAAISAPRTNELAAAGWVSSMAVTVM